MNELLQGHTHSSEDVDPNLLDFPILSLERSGWEEPTSFSVCSQMSSVSKVESEMLTTHFRDIP